MTIEECIIYLGHRIDAIHQPMLNLNVPALNGARLSRVYLPDEELKKVDRVWQVGIYDDC